MRKFLGNLVTEWDGERNMKLVHDFTYIDSKGHEWTAPKGAFLNGATIPRSLWSVIGSPYVGKYRRASVIHDYFVGEGVNPDVPRKQRRATDRMFHEACLTDGCTPKLASILYMGVTVGTWASLKNMEVFDSLNENLIENDHDKDVKRKFRELFATYEHELDKMDFSRLEGILDNRFDIEGL